MELGTAIKRKSFTAIRLSNILMEYYCLIKFLFIHLKCGQKKPKISLCIKMHINPFILISTCGCIPKQGPTFPVLRNTKINTNRYCNSIHILYKVLCYQTIKRTASFSLTKELNNKKNGDINILISTFFLFFIFNHSYFIQQSLQIHINKIINPFNYVFDIYL